jgi:DNA repair exonuclease SbcCD nuclease subunit
MKNNSRGSFLKRTVGSAAALAGTTLPTTAAPEEKAPVRLRFAVASDGHYEQPDTDYAGFYRNTVSWLNQENELNGLDFCVFNGDLIHDGPEFLPQAKAALDGLQVPYYVTRGNHDRVSSQTWQQTWGYPPDHSFTRGDFAFLLGDTSNEKGEYLCAGVRGLKEMLEKYRKKTHVFVFLHITQRK